MRYLAKIIDGIYLINFCVLAALLVILKNFIKSMNQNFSNLWSNIYIVVIGLILLLLIVQVITGIRYLLKISMYKLGE